MVYIKKVLSYLVVVILAFVAAVNYEIFVLPNSFAPSGVTGICVIIMELTGLNIGYLNMLINIPLAMLIYFKISRSIALRSMVYVVAFSAAMIVLDKLNFDFRYFTENGTSKILGPLTAGIIMGCICAMLVRAGAYTGGMDFVSLAINNKHPEKSVFFINFIINTVIAVSSFFVFDYNIEPVLLSVIYSFASTIMADRAMRTGRSAIRFEIISSKADAIADEIIDKLHHSATVIDSKGAYSGENNKMLICIINRSQLAILYSILNKYPGTFAIMDPVSEVIGNFKHLSKSGHSSINVLDSGEKSK